MDNNIFHGIKNYPDSIEGYRQMKLDVLSDFSVPITETIEREIEKRTTTYSLDNFCTYIIDLFMENPKVRNEHYLKLILAHRGVTSIRGDDAVKTVGNDGFYELVRKKYITPLGISDGITVYAV